MNTSGPAWLLVDGEDVQGNIAATGQAYAVLPELYDRFTECNVQRSNGPPY